MFHANENLSCLLLNTNKVNGQHYLAFKVALGVCFALKSWKEYLLLFTYLITLGKDVNFPLITKFKTNRPLSYLLIKYRIKMWPHRLIHAINKPVLNLYFQFEFFICKFNNSLCTSLIIRITCILVIDIHKNVIRYQIEHEYKV